MEGGNLCLEFFDRVCMFARLLLINPDKGEEGSNVGFPGLEDRAMLFLAVVGLVGK